MTTNNSLVFLLLGVAMFFAPGELPQFFPANAGDGSCTSALWLAVMGVAQVLLGTLAVLQNETARIRAAIESWDPIGRTFDMPEVQWVVPVSLYVRAGSLVKAGSLVRAGRLVRAGSLAPAKKAA